MISTDRVLGGCAALWGAFLLLYLIPVYVKGEPGEYSDPTLFPRIAGWLFIILGSLQAVISTSGPRLPSMRDLMRLCAMLFAMWLGTFLLPSIGFIPVAIGLMTFIIFIVYERRIHWVAISVLIVPLCVWTLFEHILLRPLP